MNSSRQWQSSPSSPPVRVKLCRLGREVSTAAAPSLAVCGLPFPAGTFSSAGRLDATSVDARRPGFRFCGGLAETPTGGSCGACLRSEGNGFLRATDHYNG
ncbi:hypothetical protein Sdia_02060 [Streptomyces diastaticus subsp. diastaticus]|uniref:Uncharacterized protein n=1 Tax=Streptomyces diastaticus subsp. diastaticus TaxID=68040 RepID=A0ABQ1CH52_STRDI|nr:hypothetical protein Sdia_02060 [Streptomyces diastaticus subsp. diastaticus]GGU36548.1 hypothetical protein GCM10015534_43900 [Streptomyces diastaticus subsp. diastaticus]